MKKNNAKRKSQRPECGANALLPLSKYQQSIRSLLSLWEAVTPCIFERRVQQWYTSKKMPSQCPQNGRSMIEMLGVLAIIGVLSVGGIMGYSKAMMRYKINKTIEQITYIAGNIRTTFASQGNYDGVSYTDVVKKAHIFPDDMWKDREDWPQHLWGGIVDTEHTPKTSTDRNRNKAFFIRYDGIPEEACIELLTHDWRGAQIAAVYEETTDNACDASGGTYKLPLTIDDAVKICDTSDDWVYLEFYGDIDVADSYWTERFATGQRYLSQCP